MGIFRKLVRSTRLTLLGDAQRTAIRYALPAILAGLLLGSGTAASAVELAAIGEIPAHQQATEKVEAARRAVTAALAKTSAARQRLDAFLEQHFELQGKTVEAEMPPEAAAADAKAELAHDPESERLHGNLSELRAERERLLGTLTELHPEVVDVDGRIAAVESQLQSLRGASASELPSPVFPLANQTSSADADRLRQSQAAAAEFRELFADWQTCEHALEVARAAESAAIEHLAALPVVAAPPTRPAETFSAPATSASPVARPPIIVDSERSAPAAALPPSSSSAASATSQSFALGALAIGLAIAALAAVILSRSGSDQLFANADDVAAALAVPVVGIVPAVATRDRAAAMADIRRFLAVVAQIVVAVAVFAAIAFAVQHVDAVLRFCASPVTSIRGLFGI
jgi:hypothetical protein